MSNDTFLALLIYFSIFVHYLLGIILRVTWFVFAGSIRRRSRNCQTTPPIEYHDDRFVFLPRDFDLDFTDRVVLHLN